MRLASFDGFIEDKTVDPDNPFFTCMTPDQLIQSAKETSRRNQTDAEHNAKDIAQAEFAELERKRLETIEEFKRREAAQQKPKDKTKTAARRAAIKAQIIEYIDYVLADDLIDWNDEYIATVLVRISRLHRQRRRHPDGL